MTFSPVALLKRTWMPVLLAGALAVQVSVVGTTMGVTCDECGHFGAGLFLWDYARFDVYRVNPPLVRALATAPVAMSDLKRDYRHYGEGPSVRVEWQLGQDLIAANPKRWEWYFIYGRWMVMPLVLIGAYYVYHWANELYGRTSGLVALALWCFCPNVIAWGGTFTPDAATAALGVAAGYSFWRWLRRPSWRTAIEAGLWLGMAELTKFSWIILFPLWILLWGIWHLTATPDAGVATGKGGSPKPDSDIKDNPPTRPSLVQLASVLLLGLYLIHVGYGFERTLVPLEDFVFVSRSLGGKDSRPAGGQGGNIFQGTLLGKIPIPVPYNYLRGIDQQKVDFELGMPSYLNGVWSSRGWWYYYVVAATMKVPLGTWLLGGLALLMSLCRVRFFRKGASIPNSDAPQSTWRDQLVLLAPAILLLILVSSQTGFSRYFRYVLPCFPFLYVWIGQVGLLLEDRFAASRPRLSAGLRYVTAAALSWSITSSLLVFPYSMSYFNELAGGPRNGHLHLLESNIDWAQDFFHLRNWIRRHPEAKPLRIVSCCYLSARDYGIETDGMPNEPMPGWYAMSIQRIYEGKQYNYFLKLKPVALVGYSFYIYNVSLDEANLARQELGLPMLDGAKPLEPAY